VLPVLFRGKLFRQIVPRIGTAMPLTALPGMEAMIFITVNQVLVRLWARVIKVSPSGLVAIPSFGWIV